MMKNNNCYPAFCPCCIPDVTSSVHFVGAIKITLPNVYAVRMCTLYTMSVVHVISELDVHKVKMSVWEREKDCYVFYQDFVFDVCCYTCSLFNLHTKK